ncbi:hypothetical protein ACWCYY_11950 [Kitasatospora sp. NPDC001664]
MAGHTELLSQYRTLPADRRRAIAPKASPKLRVELARAETDMAMRRSPGSLAAVLTARREMQAEHLESLVGDETGIVGIAAGYDENLYVLDDRSGSMGASDWGLTACRLALELKADTIVVESNYGGDMARQVVTQAWDQLAREGVTHGLLMPMILEVTAKVGKRLRAAPIAQLYEQGRVHHVGQYPELEGQIVTWVAGMDSPDRMDAAVHSLTELADPDQLVMLPKGLDDARLDGRRYAPNHHNRFTVNQRQQPLVGSRS